MQHGLTHNSSLSSDKKIIILFNITFDLNSGKFLHNIQHYFGSRESVRIKYLICVPAKDI